MNVMVDVLECGVIEEEIMEIEVSMKENEKVFDLFNFL